VCDKGKIMKTTNKARPAPTKGFWDWVMGGGWKNG
jgi:hypothetical protein